MVLVVATTMSLVIWIAELVVPLVFADLRLNPRTDSEMIPLSITLL